ncbi:MAG: tRNA uridine-5-carboxymethylaminomethyl(34) synthesis enzyme MnmG [bacterium]
MTRPPEESAAHYAPSPGAPEGALPASALGAATRSGRFDVVVVGAGHAGCEAAHACARMGLATALVTVRVTDTAKMSCNPAIGGVAKGHMVRELDALGGVMGMVTDRAGIQFKMLNRGRGPAVWSPRAQCDKARYSSVMLGLLGARPELAFVEGVVRRVRVVAGRAAGVELTDGRVLESRAVVITPGTFLNGVLHIGERRLAGGRLGEHAAQALSDCLGELGFERGRLKTGTPPRLHRASVDFAALRIAPGDDPPEPFSHWSGPLAVEQVSCWTTQTNERTHEVIRRNTARSPLYSGANTGSGPRYCPSIEDKVNRFPERAQHLVFLEPEGRDVDEIYVNGVSTSMPEEVQVEFIRTIAGLERAEFLRPGYAVEYDFVLPHQLDATLQSRVTPGLWLAGQICGTSGYEEAAAQGFVAGVNAARAVRGESAFVLGRDQAYIGVLVDDLVTREHREPYRMFTSAAEHRLLLRADNADERLVGTGHALGLLDDAQLERTRERWAAVAAEERRLARVSVTVPAQPTGTRSVRAVEWLARPEGRYEDLAGLGVDTTLPRELWAPLEVRVRYRGYIERQARHAAAARALEQVLLPEGFWDREWTALSNEAREKLLRWRPATVGMASRIAGVSPSDVAVLLVHARRVRGERTPAGEAAVAE